MPSPPPCQRRLISRPVSLPVPDQLWNWSVDSGLGKCTRRLPAASRGSRQYLHSCPGACTPRLLSQRFRLHLSRTGNLINIHDIMSVTMEISVPCTGMLEFYLQVLPQKSPPSQCPSRMINNRISIIGPTFLNLLFSFVEAWTYFQCSQDIRKRLPWNDITN